MPAVAAVTDGADTSPSIAEQLIPRRILKKPRWYVLLGRPHEFRHIQ